MSAIHPFIPYKDMEPGFTYFRRLNLSKIVIDSTLHFKVRLEERGFPLSIIPELKATMLQVKIGVCLELFDGITTIVVARAKPDLILLITGWEGERKNPVSPERLAKMLKISLKNYEREEKQKKTYLTRYVPKIVLADLSICNESEIANISISGRRVCKGLAFYKTSVKSFLELFRSKDAHVKTCGVLHGPVLRLMPEHESNETSSIIAVIPDPCEMKEKGLVHMNRWNTYVYVPNAA